AFLERFAQQAGAPKKSVDPTALARFCGYRWPGNVRELENEVQRAAAFAAAGAEGARPDQGDPDSLELRPRIERLERSLIREALARHGGNQTRAAEAL